MEEEAEGGGSGGRGGDLLVGDGVADDLRECRTGIAVVVGGESGSGGMSEGGEEKEKEKGHGGERERERERELKKKRKEEEEDDRDLRGPSR